MIAVADSKGAIVSTGGFDVDELIEFKASGRPVGEYSPGEPMPGDDFPGIDCDIWIPAARPDVLTADNVDRLRAKLVLQGANIPATPEAEATMHERGIISVPDFIANAGGVICASVEFHGGSEDHAFGAIESLIRRNTAEVLERAREMRITPRAAAEAMAVARVRDAARYRRFGSSST